MSAFKITIICDYYHRSGANTGTGGVGKIDGPLSLSGSSARATLKLDQDKSTFSRELPSGLNKERLLSKGSSIKYVFTLLTSLKVIANFHFVRWVLASLGKFWSILVIQVLLNLI